MSWRQLVRLAPGLQDLERQALAAHRPDGPSDWRAWEAIGGKLSQLCGWWAEHPHDPRLGTDSAWRLAYETLLFAFECGRRPGARRRDPRGGLPSLKELERLSQPTLGLTH